MKVFSRSSKSKHSPTIQSLQAQVAALREELGHAHALYEGVHQERERYRKALQFYATQFKDHRDEPRGEVGAVAKEALKGEGMNLTNPNCTGIYCAEQCDFCLATTKRLREENVELLRNYEAAKKEAAEALTQAGKLGREFGTEKTVLTALLREAFEALGPFDSDHHSEWRCSDKQGADWPCSVCKTRMRIEAVLGEKK